MTTDERIGIAVRKGDETLRRRFNRANCRLLADGAYEEINALYFPFSMVVGAVEPSVHRRAKATRPGAWVGHLVGHEVWSI